jgi:hypothetical protein
MKRRGKVVLGSVLGVFAVVVVAVVGACFWIRTASGSRFLLQQAKNYLAKSQNIQLSYSEAAIDPFSYIHIKDLKLTQNTGAKQMEVEVKSIDAIYSFSIFGRSLQVENFSISHPTIKMRMASNESKEAPMPGKHETAFRTEPDMFASLRKQVTSPSVKVFIKQMVLDGAVVDFASADPDSSVEVKIPGLGMKGSLELIPNKVSAAGEFNLDQGSEISLQTRAGESKTQIIATPYSSGKFAGGIRQESGKWVYEIQPSIFNLGTGGVVYTKVDPQSTKEFHLASVSCDSSWNILFKTVDLFKFDRTTLEKVVVKNRMGSGSMQLVTNRENGKMSEVNIDSQEFLFDADLNNGLTFVGASVTRNILSSALEKYATVTAKGKAVLASDLSNLSFQAAADINHIDVFSFKGTAKADSGIALEGDGHFTPDQKLSSLVKQGDALKKWGAIQANFSIKGKMDGPLKNLGDLDSEKWERYPAEADLQMFVIQKENKNAPAKFAPVNFFAHLNHQGGKSSFKSTMHSDSVATASIRLEPLEMGVEGELGKETATMKLVANFPQVKTKSLKKDISVSLISDANWHSDSAKLDFDTTIKVVSENPFEIYGDQYGSWSAKSQVTGEAQLPSDSSATFMQKGSLKMKGTTTLTQERDKTNAPSNRQLALESQSKLLVSEPIVFNHNLEIDNGKAKFDINSEVPSMQMTSLGRMESTHVEGSFRSSNIETAKDFDIQLQMHQGNIELAKGVAANMPALAGLNLVMKANLKDGDRFTLETFSGDFNHSMLTLSADATGKFKRKDFSIQGKMAAELPKNFPAIAGQTVQGRIEVPWSVSVIRGREINLDGNIDLKNLEWAKGPSSMKGITGRIPVSEKLVLEGTKIQFAHLITQNPFERVDYERLRPLIHGAEQVRIEQIGFEEKTYGPFVGFFSMDQNMIFAHQFDLSLGTRGLAYGELYFNVYPSNLQMGILSRLTALNLSELLPKKYLVNVPKGDKNLSGRSGIVVNLNKGSVDGRVDITEIGASQLITLINVLDPKYEDDKMNMTRSALGVGAPKFVQMAFDNGYMDLGVEMDLLGLSQRFDVREIPISTFISAATADIVKKTKEGPLE